MSADYNEELLITINGNVQDLAFEAKTANLISLLGSRWIDLPVRDAIYAEIYSRLGLGEVQSEA